MVHALLKIVNCLISAIVNDLKGVFVLLILFVFVMCLVCTLLPVSLDCLFIIATCLAIVFMTF